MADPGRKESLDPSPQAKPGHSGAVGRFRRMVPRDSPLAEWQRHEHRQGFGSRADGTDTAIVFSAGNQVRVLGVTALTAVG